MTDLAAQTIAIVGGTGALGEGLALRWSKAGHTVMVGSRDAARAEVAALKMSAISDRTIRGVSNADAAAQGDIVVLAVPYANHHDTLQSIKHELNGKILIDVTVPLVPPKVRTVQLPEAGSVAKETQSLLGAEVKVISAFQNVAAAHLVDLDHEIDCDVLVCGNDKTARQTVIDLANDAGLTAWHAGRIDNSAVAEALTSALIFINGHYKIAGAGIRITGTPVNQRDE